MSFRLPVQSLAVTTSFASTDVAGTMGTVTVTAFDAYGNVVGSGPNQYEGTVDLTDTDGIATGLPSAMLSRPATPVRTRSTT